MIKNFLPALLTALVLAACSASPAPGSGPAPAPFEGAVSVPVQAGSRPGYIFAGWTSGSPGETSGTNLNKVWIPDNLLFTRSGTGIEITGAVNLKGNLVIPPGVTSIGHGAFMHCTCLTGVFIPSSVTNIGDFAFNTCTGLTDIRIPEGVRNIGQMVFGNCYALTNIRLPAGLTNIGLSAFSLCYSLKTLDLPESLVSIGSAAFDSSGLERLDVHEGLRSIGDLAFSGCTGLCLVVLPESLANLGKEVFNSSGLASIRLAGDNPPSLPSGSQSFDYCSSSLHIMVDSNCLSAYRSAPGWNVYADRIGSR